VSTAYSHVWRAADSDFPRNPTGREGRDSNSEIYVEVASEEGLTYVPQEQLVTFASWKAEQSKAAQKTPAAANACLIAALRYAERGWRVFPVPFGTKRSHTSAKRSNGRAWGATRDPMEIEYGFKRWPDAGVGIPPGKATASSSWRPTPWQAAA
jgi:Bifunctional DNA primase/polymerase, N-terminal